jgi:CheY-like chemotaxis protein
VVREYRPEIVLLDIGLPGMNGYEVARALRANDGDERPILIAVSGYGSQQDRARSAEAGFDGHFVKPMEIEALREFLDSRHENRQ